jgi:hypothetical protein
VVRDVAVASRNVLGHLLRERRHLEGHPIGIQLLVRKRTCDMPANLAALVGVGVRVRVRVRVRRGACLVGSGLLLIAFVPVL